MRILAARSEVAAADDWLWLQPLRRSVRLRHTLASFLLAVLVIAAMATSTLLPIAFGAPATAVVVVAAVALVVRTAREGSTRLGMSQIGVLVQMGSSVSSIGWTAVEGLRGIPGVRGRWRIAVDAGRDSRVTRARFDAAPARQWLAAAADEARRRRLEPVELPDGAGFTTGR